MRRTPLKRYTPLRAKTLLRAKSHLKSKTTLKQKSDSKKAKLIAQLDNIFSQFVRLRDSDEHGRAICISCQRELPYEYMQAGHFYPRTHMATRWDEDNVHSECVTCNCFTSDHLIKYKGNLIKKIGTEAFERITKLHNQPRNFDECELQMMIAYYKQKVKMLQQGRLF